MLFLCIVPSLLFNQSISYACIPSYKAMLTLLNYIEFFRIMFYMRTSSTTLIFFLISVFSIQRTWYFHPSCQMSCMWCTENNPSMPGLLLLPCGCEWNTCFFESAYSVLSHLLYQSTWSRYHLSHTPYWHIPYSVLTYPILRINICYVP